jgi:NAD-dependent protein deacetylase/lipoamidase
MLSSARRVTVAVFARDGLILDDPVRVLALTGSGVSAASGIPTCSGAVSAQDGRPFEWLASAAGFEEAPDEVWAFYSRRRREALQARPNPGHEALVRLEEALGERFLLVTQNVDGLHGRAGSRRAIELHGSLMRSRCSRCDRAAFEDVEDRSAVSVCEVCGGQGERGLLRPGVVWFGEEVARADWARIHRFLGEGVAAGERLVLLVVGTSGKVNLATHIADLARRQGAETWYVDTGSDAWLGSFDHRLEGPSETLLPLLVARALDDWRGIRDAASRYTGEVEVPLTAGGCRRITGVPSGSALEILTFGLNGAADWTDLTVVSGGKRFTDRCVDLYCQGWPTCHVGFAGPEDLPPRRISTSLATGELLYAVSRSGGELRIQAGHFHRRVEYPKIVYPGFLFECRFPSPPPVHSALFDTALRFVGLVDHTEPDGLAMAVPSDYRMPMPNWREEFAGKSPTS